MVLAFAFADAALAFSWCYEMKMTSLRQALSLFLLFACIAVVLIGPMAFKAGIPDIYDFFNHLIGIIEAKMAWTQGQFPLRTAPAEQFGWSYPFYQFFSVSAYTFAGLIYQWFTPSNPLHAYWLMIWLALLGGGIYMYRLAYWFVGSRPAAILSGVVFLVSPYYLIVIHHMSDFNEAVAIGILPAFIYYSLQCFQPEAKVKSMLQTSLVFYLLATTHLITFLYSALFVILLLVLMTLKNVRNTMNLLRVALAYVFGSILAMWFLAPIVLYKKYLNIEAFYGDIKTFSAYKLSLATLLSPWRNVSNGKPGYIVDSIAQVHPNIGIPFLFAVIVCAYFWFRKSKLQNARADTWLPTLLFLFFAALVMVWSPLNFWQWLPKSFLVCQYSWRLLLQASWIGALLFAWALCFLFKNKLNGRHVALGICMIIVINGGWLATPERDFLKLDVPTVVKKPQLLWNPRVYLVNPDKIKDLKKDELIATEEKLDPKVSQMYCRQEKSSKVCEIIASKALKIIELPMLYYPDLLEITVNGKTVPYTSVLFEDHIVAAIKPEVGMNVINLRFRGLVWANCASSVAWELWLVLLLYFVMDAIADRVSVLREKYV